MQTVAFTVVIILELLNVYTLINIKRIKWGMIVSTIVSIFVYTGTIWYFD